MRVLYEDREIVVCVKDAGVLSQASEKGKEADMTALLAAHFAENGEAATPHVVHRLDRGTGGVMVYAKTEKAAAALREQRAEARADLEARIAACDAAMKIFLLFGIAKMCSAAMLSNASIKSCVEGFCV